MSGIPLNTIENRKKYDIKTKIRLLSTSYAEIGDDFSVEHEEIVTSTSTISEEDFLLLEKLVLCFLLFIV